MKKFKDTKEAVTPDDISRVGMKAKLLRENEIFLQVVNEVYEDLVSAEDSVTADASVEPREGNDLRRNFSGMRVALVAIMQKLDDKIHLAETNSTQEV